CHLVLDAAAVGHDVRSVLGERPGDVLEEARAIPGFDRNLDAEALRRAPVPAHRRETLRLARERLDVRTVSPVDGDALAERDVADDFVSRHGRAELRGTIEDVVDAVTIDDVVVADDRLLL